MPRYYPVHLNLVGKPCLVIGGGEVARRKVGGLLQSGAAVTVIGPEISPELARLAEEGRITVIPRKYRRGDLKGMFLVFGATDDPEAGAAITEEAAAESCLVNLADQPSRCDFILPALLERGDLAISFSTQGRCPALAQWLRDRTGKDLGEVFAEVTELLGSLRDRMLTRGDPPPTIKHCIQEALDSGFIELVRSGDRKKAELLLQKIAESAAEKT